MAACVGALPGREVAMCVNYSSVRRLKEAFDFGLTPAPQATEPQSAAHKVLCRYIEVPCLKRTAAGSLSIEVE